MKRKDSSRGKLRIGDDWNAITIIALSQSNPLKAVAEFVENSIDAGARHVTISRGREKGLNYLKIKDDGAGVPRNATGEPDFHYVATHICDSIKRRLKAQGTPGLQGEFGIGLLSFWTLGEELVMTSAGADGASYQMQMRRGNPDYRVTRRAALLPESGTELQIRGILPGARSFSGEKIQWYLASELRDRIRSSGVQIRVIDRTARAEYRVEPRQFEGRLLHGLPAPASERDGLYVEIYLNGAEGDNRVSLYRRGTRVLSDLAELEGFARPPWSTGMLQGLVDAGYLQLTPGTRLGVIHDAALDRLRIELEPIERALVQVIEDHQRAAEETASRDVLRSIQSALREALMSLPPEEYDWFQLRRRSVPEPAAGRGPTGSAEHGATEEGNGGAGVMGDALKEDGAAPEPQMQFFEHAGPLFSVRIAPATTVVKVGESRPFAAVARDRSRRPVESDVVFDWLITEGEGTLEPRDAEIATFRAGPEPGLVRIRLMARQDAITCEGEAIVTVTDELLPANERDPATRSGIPGYTFEKAPGQLWRSKFDPARNLIVINNGHRDFVYASKSRALKLRYLSRLFCKELVLRNFTGMGQEPLLERLIELTLYMEENLR